MLEEVTQPNYKSFTFPRLSDCQKSHIDSIIIFRKKIIIKKNICQTEGCMSLVSNANQHVWNILTGPTILNAEAGGLIPLSAAKKERQKKQNKKRRLIRFENKWNYIWNESNDLTWVQDMFFSPHSRQNQLQNITLARVLGWVSLSLGCLCAHGRDSFTSSAQPGFSDGPEAAAGFSRRWLAGWLAGHPLQASFKWEELLTPITYSPALQRLIFITSIILYNKYSNPDPKSRA